MFSLSSLSRLADRTGDKGPFLPGMLPDLSWPQTQLREVRAKRVDASCGIFIVTRPSWMGTYPDMHAIYVGGDAYDGSVYARSMRVPWRELGACESVGCRQGCWLPSNAVAESGDGIRGPVQACSLSSPSGFWRSRNCCHRLAFAGRLAPLALAGGASPPASSSACGDRHCALAISPQAFASTLKCKCQTPTPHTCKRLRTLGTSALGTFVPLLAPVLVES